MNKIILVAIGAIIIVGGAFLLLINNNKTKDTSETTNQFPVAPVTTATYTTPAPIPTSTPIPTTHSVSIQNFSFSQQSIIIKKGDTVVWTNKDSASHTITGTNSGLNSGTLNTNGTYNFTFNTAGTFNYKCAFHPSMIGSVIAQ